MYAVSDGFLAALRQGQTVRTRLDVCTVDGEVLATIDATGGDVTVDATRQVRRECSFTVPDIDGTLVPAERGDLLSSLSGHELRPYRGLLVDGVEELVPLGVFPIRSCPTEAEEGVAVITLGGQDRSSTVSRNRWTDYFEVPAGTLESALQVILNDRVPQFPTDFPATGIDVPTLRLGTSIDNDPWYDALSIAAAGGYDLHFDVNGVAVITQPVDVVDAVPVLTYADDEESVTLAAGKAWDSDEAFNGVIVIGESSAGVPVRGEAWDDDEDSPTYVGGNYGRYPKTIITPLVLTETAAGQYAAAELARLRGTSQQVTWTQIVNPAHDANDAVLFTNRSLRIDTALTVVLESFTIPWLASDTMPARTRTRQVTL